MTHKLDNYTITITPGNDIEVNYHDSDCYIDFFMPRTRVLELKKVLDYKWGNKEKEAVIDNQILAYLFAISRTKGQPEREDSTNDRR